MASETEPDIPVVARKVHISGIARPRAEVLRGADEFSERIAPSSQLGYKYDRNRLWRWQSKLDCGCVEERLTHGEVPSERPLRNFLHGGTLPPGQRLCLKHDHQPTPFRAIDEWLERRVVTFPPDPVEPKYNFEPELWQVFRNDHEHICARWTVHLSCDHQTEVTTPLEWKPGDEPRRLATPEHQREMIDEAETSWASEPDPDAQEQLERDHWHRRLNDGFPVPDPEARCWACSYARWIVGYHSLGWLVPRQKPKPSKRELLTRRLNKLEADAAKVRRELEQLS
ncbi:hypothetical protein E1263_15960 [Kribbella antibiotica]|uniref:Uncharacterized protein n=1 Tax=Kribbella antibiotica TaxID=190195 RepID=A0A4R4ZQC8_9ACTN|nr:hypothetical protein [Kribbella antibiotica]TDD59152.1 hypothetical protein E1263_15960 [Kribbella antibiotica]